jgi:DNA-binding CsgD family transcriptional regulator
MNIKLFILFIFLKSIPTFLAAQNLEELFAKKTGVERMMALGGKINDWAKQPEKLAALKKLTKEKCTEEEKLFVDRATDPIINIENPSFEQQLANADYYVKKFNATKYPFLKAVAYYTKAVRYRDNKHQNQALENFMYCYDALSKDADGTCFEQSWYLHGIASSYYRFNDYTKTIDIAKKAEQLGSKYTPNGDWFDLINSNLVGMAFLKNSNYDSARVWLQTTYNRAIKRKNEFWVGIAGGNIGNTYYLHKQYSKAIPYFKTAIDTCIKLNLYDNTSAFSVNLADCYMHLGQTALVAPLLDQAQKANVKDPQTDALFKYYKLAASYYKFMGNTALAFENEDSANVYDKKLTSEYDIAKKVRVEADWAYSKSTLEREIEIQKAKREKWILYSVLAMAILLFIIGVLYYKRQRLRFLLKQEHLENEQLKMKEDLQEAQIQLQEFTDNIRQKNELIVNINAEINSLQKQNITIADEQLVSIEALKQSSILTAEDWNDFKTLFRKAYPTYLSKIAIEYPEFTPAETRYILLSKLNLSSREMASMLGVSTENIRNLRFRVKKKMNVEDGVDMDERLKNL